MLPRNQFYTRDAQQRALNFLVNQAQRIERTVYQMRYAEIQYPQLVPVDTAGPDWLTGVWYWLVHSLGQ
jgi:hypothetical protein